MSTSLTFHPRGRSFWHPSKALRSVGESPSDGWTSGEALRHRRSRWEARMGSVCRYQWLVFLLVGNKQRYSSCEWVHDDGATSWPETNRQTHTRTAFLFFFTCSVHLQNFQGEQKHLSVFPHQFWWITSFTTLYSPQFFLHHSLHKYSILSESTPTERDMVFIACKHQNFYSIWSEAKIKYSIWF